MFEILLKRVAAALEKAGIPYMIIGGQAVLLYGSPRLTRDIDITLGIDTDRLDVIMRICRTLKFEMLSPDPQGFARETKVLPVKDPRTELRVDFIFSFTPYERQAIKRSKKISIGRQTVRFAGVEDVLIHKMLAGRAIDDQDIEAILLKNLKKKARVNLPYVYRWLKEFEGFDEYKGILGRFKKMVSRARGV